MNFNNAIQNALSLILKKNKKNLYFGLEVTNVGVGLKEKFPNQVFETPVSELASTGLCVGLASQGFKPQIVYGRVEFAMLAFDQIFTQAGRWNYSFGNNSNCPVSFRIQIGRQWGNGPQHTANYHSIFLQSYGLDIFIPSTPREAFDQLLFMNSLNYPSVMLEHRYLCQVNENFKIKKNSKTKIKTSTVYGKKNKNDILLVTYADTLIDSLKAKKILEKNGIHATVINFSYFPYKKRLNPKDFEIFKNFKNIIFIDSAPFEFGILSGILSYASINLKNKSYFYLSPPNIPSPASAKLLKKYYINKKDIINKVCEILKRPNIKINKLSFDDIILWPDDCISDLK